MPKEKEMNNEIEIYPHVAEELKKQIHENALSLGLGQIDYDKFVSLEKISEKVKNPRNYPKAYQVIERAYINIIGNEELVWLYLFKSDGTWFRSSPIMRVDKIEDIDNYSIFQIETENSLYNLAQRID
jgi:hypothetical protein